MSIQESLSCDTTLAKTTMKRAAGIHNLKRTQILYSAQKVKMK